MMYNKQKLACAKEKSNTALRVKDNRKFEFQMRKRKVRDRIPCVQSICDSETASLRDSCRIYNVQTTS